MGELSTAPWLTRAASQPPRASSRPSSSSSAWRFETTFERTNNVDVASRGMCHTVKACIKWRACSTVLVSSSTPEVIGLSICFNVSRSSARHDCMGTLNAFSAIYHQPCHKGGAVCRSFCPLARSSRSEWLSSSGKCLLLDARGLLT